MISARLFYIFFLLFIMPGILLNSCIKVGEDDPAISLRSRKSRVAGKWKVTKAFYISTFDRMPLYLNKNINFENGTFTYNEFSIDMGLQRSRIDTSGKYEWNIEFTRSGSYNNFLQVNGSKREVNGTWEFASKDSVNISSIGFMTDAGFLRGLIPFFFQGKYYLKELRHDKMVFFAKDDFSSGELVNLEIVLEPQ
jgi:hypothetical protein